MLQFVEEEKLELEAVVNQQRREDGCGSPPVHSAARDESRPARLCFKIRWQRPPQQHPEHTGRAGCAPPRPVRVHIKQVAAAPFPVRLRV